MSYEHPAVIVKHVYFIVISVILITTSWNIKISIMKYESVLFTVSTCQIDQVINTGGSDTIQFRWQSRHFSPLGGDSNLKYLGRSATDYEEYKVVQVIIIAGTGVVPSPRDKVW